MLCPRDSTSVSLGCSVVIKSIYFYITVAFSRRIEFTKLIYLRNMWQCLKLGSKKKKSKSSRRNEVRDLLMRIVDKVNLMVVESKNFSIILHYSVLKWLMLSQSHFLHVSDQLFQCIELTLVCFELTCIETTFNQNNHTSLPDITIECSIDWYWKLFGVLWERSPHNPTVF